ncbi:MAG: ABC transporter ATP-binding protein [Acidimicrobiales bacterium]
MARKTRKVRAGKAAPVEPVEEVPRPELLRLTDVTRTYGDGPAEVRALDSVSLEIFAGDYVSIIGPSGSGKSTLLGLLGCLDLPTSGSIRVAGREVTDLDDAERSKVRGESIGFIFQQFHLIPYLSALANVATALLYRNLSRGDIRDTSMDALTRVGLAARYDHVPTQLSGGEQQRVAIARAIVTDPLLVLADEPTGALDTQTADMVLEILEDLQSEARAVVVVTHDLAIAERTHRVVSMLDGQIVTDDINRDWADELADRLWEDAAGVTLE